jgi:hypothetical protein
MEDKNVDPSKYKEFPDEDYDLLCTWWYKDREYRGWFRPEDVMPVEEYESKQKTLTGYRR